MVFVCFIFINAGIEKKLKKEPKRDDVDSSIWKKKRLKKKNL